jgi:hypothetical protein
MEQMGEEGVAERKVNEEKKKTEGWAPQDDSADRTKPKHHISENDIQNHLRRQITPVLIVWRVQGIRYCGSGI